MAFLLSTEITETKLHYFLIYGTACWRGSSPGEIVNVNAA
jgi:hypothetical protein